jgi:hypothetical protein
VPLGDIQPTMGNHTGGAAVMQSNCGGEFNGGWGEEFMLTNVLSAKWESK